ncbi:MAG: hypothetical protein ACRD5G_05845 [Candidatus Acidiferrales bacterium]
MPCAICNKRPEKRYCPAKPAMICAICCGTEREVSIDCPADCRYLLEARRYEAEHRKPVPPDEVPYPDERIPAGLLHQHRPVVSGLGLAILKLAAESRSLNDTDIIASLSALADAYRTLSSSGLYYEKPPDDRLRAELYRRLGEFLNDYRKPESQQPGQPPLRDTDVFLLLVFLMRIARHHHNGRPRSRAFLDYLRGQYPAEAIAAAEPPRIIAP